MDASRPSPLNTDQIRVAALEKTSTALHDAFQVLDDTLFNLSQSSPHSYHMDALRVLRTQRDALLNDWTKTIGEAFIAENTPPQASSDVLTLVANDELEKQLAVQQMGALWIKHHSQEITTIERLLESAHTDPHQFPLHPTTLSRLVGQWIENVDLPTESQLVSLKILEREFDKVLKSLYIKTIDLLRNQGLKDSAPQFQRTPSPQPSQPPMEVPSWLEQVDHIAPAENPPAENRPHNTTHPRYGQPTSAPHWDQRTQQLLSQALSELLGNEKHALHSAPSIQHSIQHNEDDWNIDPVNWDPTAEDLLHALQSRRNHRPGPQQSVPTMSQSAVRSVLDVLQRDLPQSVRNVARDDYQLLTKQFKVEMLDKALQIGVRDKNSALTDRDEDAIDIVGMLFEIFLSEREIIADMRENIAQLLAAYVKVAINDRKMFMHKAHPARRFLDVLAQACEGNNGVSSSERNTLNKVSDSIDKLVTNFNEDVAIFELAESEIKNFIAQQKLAVEHSEKRAAEAQKGAERLDAAKRESQNIFEQHTKQWPWAATQLNELKKYWLQHHTITQLRNENDAEKIQQSKEILQNILNVVENRTSDLSQLNKDLQTILNSSGVTDTAASSVASQILDQVQNVSPIAPLDFTPSSVSIESHVTVSPTVERAPLEIPNDTNSLENHQSLVEYFKNMPLGTWVDFVRSDGQILPTKLSWVSPISMRLLFVTTRGTKHAVEYPEDLAKLVVLDRVRLREFGVGESGFEHSFKKAVEQLHTPTVESSEQPSNTSASFNNTYKTTNVDAQKPQENF